VNEFKSQGQLERRDFPHPAAALLAAGIQGEIREAFQSYLKPHAHA